MSFVRKIKGVYGDDLPQLLEKLGLKDDFESGRISCTFSNEVITRENFLGIFSDGQEIKFAADNETARAGLAEIAQKAMDEQTASAVATALGDGFGKGLTAGVSGTVIVAMFVLYLWVSYPNNVKLIFAHILKALSFVFGGLADRYYVVNHLEGKVGKSIERLNQKVEGLDAEQIKITLVREIAREAFIRDRVLIMRLQKKDNHGENMANVAILYSEHLYSKVDSSLSETQQDAIRLYTAISILKSAGSVGLQALSDKFYKPMIAKNSYMQGLLNQLEVIDNKGLFFSVFIQEMVFLGNKVMFRQRVKGVNEEVKKFIKFLVSFAKRRRGDDAVEMDFRSTNMKVSFVLVAVREKRDANETESYVRRVRDLLPRDTESFYFMGWGENIDFVRQVAKTVSGSVDYPAVKREKGTSGRLKTGGSSMRCASSSATAVSQILRNHLKRCLKLIKINSPTRAMFSLVHQGDPGSPHSKIIIFVASS